MSQPQGAVPSGFVVKLSVPAEGPLRVIATDVAGKIAEYLQTSQPVDSVTAAVESAASEASGGSSGDITLEFRLVDRELLIEARCGSRTSEVRCQLPA
jgi:hypothetical protein